MRRLRRGGESVRRARVVVGRALGGVRIGCPAGGHDRGWGLAVTLRQRTRRSSLVHGASQRLRAHLSCRKSAVVHRCMGRRWWDIGKWRAGFVGGGIWVGGRVGGGVGWCVVVVGDLLGNGFECEAQGEVADVGGVAGGEGGGPESARCICMSTLTSTTTGRRITEVFQQTNERPDHCMVEHRSRRHVEVDNSMDEKITAEVMKQGTFGGCVMQTMGGRVNLHRVVNMPRAPVGTPAARAHSNTQGLFLHLHAICVEMYECVL